MIYSLIMFIWFCIKIIVSLYLTFEFILLSYIINIFGTEYKYMYIYSVTVFLIALIPIFSIIKNDIRYCIPHILFELIVINRFQYICDKIKN